MPMILAQEPEFTIRYLERVENATAEEQQAALDQFGGEALPTILSIEGNVATISITGPLSPKGPSDIARYFGFGGTGYQDIISAVQEVKGNPSITEVRFPTDSPGGTVTMVDETRQEIADLAKVKRVVFENHGLIASAAIWLASAAHEIVATSPTVESGSIGVKIVGYDVTAALKEYGYKKIVILSQNAPNKAAGVDTKDGRNELQRQADAMERIFIARMAEGRGVSEQTVIDDFGKGGLLVAKDPDSGQPDAISVGLIDRLVEGSGVTELVAENDDDDEGHKSSSKVDGISDIVDPKRVQNRDERQRQKGGESSASSTTEGNTMSLEKLLADNPGAQAEYDAAIKSATEQGIATGQEQVEARVKAATPYLAADSEYPAPITTLAAQVVAGTADISALTTAVTVIDAIGESTASGAAGDESDEQGDTNAQQHTQGTGAVVTETNEDHAAAVATARKSRGSED